MYEEITKELEPIPTFELASFETPVSLEVVRPIQWSVQKYEVAQMMALQGKSKAQISRDTKVPLGTINYWASHPDFVDYLKSLIDSAAASMKNQNISLLSKIIAARVAEAELSGNYASLSKMDTAVLLRDLTELTEADNKREESNYAKLLEKLVIGSMSGKNAIEIGRD